MSIAGSVLDAVRTESKNRGASRVTGIGLRVGQLAGVEPESLRFCWEVLVSGTEFDHIALDIEFRPWAKHCCRCDRTFQVEDYNVNCPACGCSETEPAGGDELELAWLEVDENEPHTTGTQSSERK